MTTLHGATGALAALSALVTVASRLHLPQSAAPVTATVKYSRKNPFPSELNERVLLNGRGSAKETIHLEFNLEGSGLTYEAGDALAVIPHNAQDVVDAILGATQARW